MNTSNNIFTVSNYSENLSGNFDMNMQSYYIGQGGNLSIKYFHVHYNFNGSLHYHHYSKFSDKNPKNVASTDEHMPIMIDKLLDDRII